MYGEVTEREKSSSCPVRMRWRSRSSDSGSASARCSWLSREVAETMIQRSQSWPVIFFCKVVMGDEDDVILILSHSGGRAF